MTKIIYTSKVSFKYRQWLIPLVTFAIRMISPERRTPKTIQSTNYTFFTGRGAKTQESLQ